MATGMDADTQRLDYVIGDRTGLRVPAHAQALLAGGPEFLTRAFHAFGSLSRDNAVVKIVTSEPFTGGNSGHKLRLWVEYARPAPGLDTALFVKFSRDFADPHCDRRRYELEAEVRLALLSRHPAFPVTVPHAWFADFEQASGTGLVIYQQIAFGAGGIEPMHTKCMDYDLDEPVRYYRATVKALARLIAAHRSGVLAPLADELFPFDPVIAVADLPIPWSEAEVSAKIAGYADLARECPRLFPEIIRKPEFIARFDREARRFVRNQHALREFLYADPDFVALAHWNTNIDNAWFFREPDGTLGCGLLDWGMVRQMNVMLALWGGLSAGDAAMLENHLDDLEALFAAEIASHGGPILDPALMRVHLDLSLALVGLSMMLDIAQLIRIRLPDAAQASGPRDPCFQADQVVRGFHTVFVNFLCIWERHDFGAAIDRALQGQG